jgi:F0F1-type ATP synthase membrane subunit b/b'
MKSSRHFFAFASGAVFVFFVSTLPSYAAEGAGADAAESSAGLIFRWLNFAIVFGGIGYLIAKHGRTFFHANAKAIAASIHEGTAAKEEADRQLREVQTKIAHFDQEVAELRVVAQRDSTAEAERLNVSRVAETEKIRAAARAELAATERVARQELRAIASTLAVQRAAAVVGSRMSPEVRARLFQSFLRDLERGKN